jgi:hypothetical protein
VRGWSSPEVLDDLDAVAVLLGRALESLGTQDVHDTVERAAAEIAAARETLARVRRALDR